MAEDSIRTRQPACPGAAQPPPGPPGGKTGGVGSRKAGAVSSQKLAKAGRLKGLRALFEAFQDGKGAFRRLGLRVFGGKFHTWFAWIEIGRASCRERVKMGVVVIG